MSNYIQFTSHRNRLIQCLMTLLAVLSIASPNLAQGHIADTYPIPQQQKHLLFYLQRSKDANTIVYALNNNNGILDENNPVVAYWIRYTEGGIKKELSSLQKRFAFGIKSKRINDGHYELTLAGYDKIPIILKKSSQNNYNAYVVINGKEMLLKRIYIDVQEGGSFWSPNVQYVEFKGVCPLSGQTITQQIKPTKT